MVSNPWRGLIGTVVAKYEKGSEADRKHNHVTVVQSPDQYIIT
jgi:hypothetical protein